MLVPTRKQVRSDDPVRRICAREPQGRIARSLPRRGNPRSVRASYRCTDGSRRDLIHMRTPVETMSVPEDVMLITNGCTPAMISDTLPTAPVSRRTLAARSPWANQSGCCLFRGGASRLGKFLDGIRGPRQSVAHSGLSSGCGFYDLVTFCRKGGDRHVRPMSATAHFGMPPKRVSERSRRQPSRTWKAGAGP